MERDEKILAIQLLLEDNRGAFWIDNRSLEALKLANELKEDDWEYADNFISHIQDFRNGDCEGDGRFFRDSYEYGGYELMDELHWFKNFWEYSKHTITDKSKEFQEIMMKNLQHLEYTFEESDYWKFISRQTQPLGCFTRG